MIKKIIAFTYNNIRYRKRIALFNNLKKRNAVDDKRNLNYQIDKLSCVLEVAFENIDYYKKFKFSTKDFSYSDFMGIPILTKEIIRNQTSDLVSPAFFKLRDVLKNTSGGSTGEPVTFFQTKEQKLHGIVNYLLALNQNGVHIYDESVDLWGAERDMYKTTTRFNLRSFLHNKTTLNTFVLSDEIIQDYINRLNEIKPKFIKAYVHSVYEISKFINKHNIKINFIPAIHCTTGPLYPEMKKEIKKAFNNAHVYNFYGSREVSAIASEIKDKKGMFVLYDNVFIEVLDENNKPVKKGEEGEIVVTTLNNFYMPLLRYKIGDRAIKGDELEFGSLKLDSVTGRTLGVIHKKDGTKIDGQFFTTLFFNKKGIKNFQLIQQTISNLQLNIVKSDNFNQLELDAVIQRIKSELGDINLNINFLDKINLTSTGKIMYAYSELES
ncbi:hypothetical protein ACFFU9_09900 [Mariniflexile ostreae]|uniref:Phenylacetate-CoA ligase n=1 Tax=Mariniflexile ostreae TaxID=1520892 RepID=A0ABV5FD70_9FLAO